MSRRQFPAEVVLVLFREFKVLRKADVLTACGCGPMTFWKILSEHGYLTSYNFNAKFYTLMDIPKFDEDGLWSYGKVRFSQWGNTSRGI